MERESIERAIDGCYDAIVDPERWPDAMHALARSLDAVCGMFIRKSPTRPCSTCPRPTTTGTFWMSSSGADGGGPTTMPRGAGPSSGPVGE